jgi:hypothetical protein
LAKQRLRDSEKVRKLEGCDAQQKKGKKKKA